MRAVPGTAGRGELARRVTKTFSHIHRTRGGDQVFVVGQEQQNHHKTETRTESKAEKRTLLDTNSLTTPHGTMDRPRTVYIGSELLDPVVQLQAPRLHALRETQC